MKKYNRPEIEALALEVIDVIETSGGDGAAAMMTEANGFTITDTNSIQVVSENIATMSNQWQW